MGDWLAQLEVYPPSPAGALIQPHQRINQCIEALAMERLGLGAAAARTWAAAYPLDCGRLRDSIVAAKCSFR